MTRNIHKGQSTLRVGANSKDAEKVVILLHGRGATAESLLPLTEALSLEKTSFILPQASLNRWYPNSAFAPLESNEPDLTSALELVGALIEMAHEEGFSDDQIAIGGFSQGACLALEYAARNPRQYAGVFALTGALIGPPGTQRNYPGSFDGMPVFIGGGDNDPWVAHELIVESAAVFEQMGAKVDFRTYPNMPHTINQDELDAVQAMLLA